MESPAQHTTVIRPSRGWVSLQLRELWDYRELLYFFIWRDVKVRYKQTVIGIAWAVIQPVMMVLVFTLLFGTVANISFPGPYPVYALAATLPWNIFLRGLSEGSTSLVSNQSMITKVYFPRLLLPAASVVAGLVDFVVGFGVLIGLMWYYGIVPTIATVALPLFIVVDLAAAIGIASWMSAMDARFRDVRYALPFLSQLWFFATPVVYPLSKIPADWRWLVGINPMTSVVDLFRWALLGQPISFDLPMLLSLLIVLVIFVGGLYYFRRAERTFADLV